MNRSYSPLSFSLNRFQLRRGVLFGALILTALLAFEIFNYSTTDYSLTDLLGSLRFLGVRWATILSIAFCGIDFAGLARLFTPEQGADEPQEVWYLFGAWLLAATMNAFLTWWGVSVAILNHTPSANAIIGHDTVLKVVPVFVAIMVWLIRVLIIGTFSVAGDRLFSQANRRTRPTTSAASTNSVRQPNTRQPAGTRLPLPVNRSLPTMGNASFRPMPKNNPVSTTGVTRFEQRPEPSYSPISMGSATNQGRDSAQF
jgi:hypothetical protein